MTKICDQCKEPYQSTHINSRFCGTTCRNKSSYLRTRKPPQIVTCIHCGDKFEKRANFNNLCKDCKSKHNAGLKPVLHADIKIRDNTNEENTMINNFLKGK